MPLLAPQQPPPADYYAANIRTLLTHVVAFHGDLLAAAEMAFARNLLACSTPALRLFARLITRKGPWIRVDKLNYREVADTPAALRELELLQVVVINPCAPADALLGLLTNPERRSRFAAVPPQSKTAWIRTCVSRYSDHQIRVRLAEDCPWIAVRDWRHFRLCQLLFFGDDHQDTSTFVLQDLGLVRYADYSLERSDRLFATRQAVDVYLTLQHRAHLSRRLDEHPELSHWLSAVLWLPHRSRHEQRQTDRILNRLGRWFERRGAFDDALSCYGRSRTHPARERRVRILDKLTDEPGMHDLLRSMRGNPRCAQEQDFAQRYPRRRVPLPMEVTTVHLSDLPEQPRQIAIEQYSADLLSAAGGAAWHLENQLPLAMAGLAFWSVIFAPVRGAFVNPFQNAPLDLMWPDFATTREQHLAPLEKALLDPQFFRQTVLDNFDRHQGTANRFVSWRHWTTQRLTLLLEQIPHAVLFGIASHVIHQPYRARNGFPDLTVLYGNGSYEFVEVKGPTDQLQPAQRIWLQVLCDLRCSARVLKFK